MSRWIYGEAKPTDGERLLRGLDSMRAAWARGQLGVHPHDFDVNELAVRLGVSLELVVSDEWGWTAHLMDELLRYDCSWEYPWRLLCHADWEHYMEVLDATAELGLGPDDAR